MDYILLLQWVPGYDQGQNDAASQQNAGVVLIDICRRGGYRFKRVTVEVDGDIFEDIVVEVPSAERDDVCLELKRRQDGYNVRVSPAKGSDTDWRQVLSAMEDRQEEKAIVKRRRLSG